MRQDLGVNAHLPSAVTLDLAVAAGFGSIRADFNWPMMQPERDRWDWSVTDQVVSDARSRGLEIYATLSQTPPWASQSQARNSPPDYPHDWATFVQAVAERYRHQVWHWGIFNEPNIHGYWTGSVEQYVDELVLPAAQVLHRMGPEQRVCAPDLSTEGEWPDWLRTMLRRSQGAVDLVTVHSYQRDGAMVWQRLSEPPRWWAFWQDPCVHQVIHEGHAGHLDVWVAEVGWNTADVTEAQQAAYYLQLLEGLAAQPWVTRLFTYQLQDEPAPLNWGIYHTDGTPKPAVAVVQRHSGGVV
jgi:polysaccharide biosynthesis protein PslG